MKTKKLLILLFILAAIVFEAKASGNDTVWTSYHWKGYKVSVLGGDLHYYIKSKVKIEADNKDENFTVQFTDGKLEKIDNNWYYITPNNIGNCNIEVNDKSYPIQIFPIPDPQVNFDGRKSDWKGVISKEELTNTTKIAAKNKYTNFEILSYSIAYLNDGELRSIRFKDTILNVGILATLQRTIPGQKFYIQDIMVKNPDGTTRILPDQEFKVIDNYKNEFIRKTIVFKPYTYDLNRIKTDLRIKFEGDPTKGDIKTVTDLANELNKILETINVKIVDRQPTVTLIFDSIFEGTSTLTNLIAKGYEKIDCGYKLVSGNIFFPFRKKSVLHVNTSIDPELRSVYLRKNIVELLGEFKAPGIAIGKDSSILNYNGGLSSYDKYMLKTLYAFGGEDEVQIILDNNFDPPDRNVVFFIMLILSVILLFIFSEIYNYYGFSFKVGKIKSKITRRIIESALIAQIPSIAILILLIEKFLEGDFHEIGFVLLMEIFFIPFAILTGLLFLGLDSLLIKIKRKWLVTILNFFFSFFCIWLAYQVIYLFITPEVIYPFVVGWKIMLIPFLITLYRIYARFQSNKISGLLQEKELELTKQKELKFKSDLNALQARINPHFLYNALNSLASLAYIDAAKTEKMALSLSKLFRYNINKEDEHFSSIKEEVEMAEIYLEIEKNRFDDKLEYTIEVQNSLLDFQIPKFILQPLAENAVKHGVSKITEKGIIKIKIFEEAQKVCIEIYDNGPAFPGGLTSGYGLQNTYEKFKLLYKKPFDIEFINKPEKKLVIMLTK